MTKNGIIESELIHWRMIISKSPEIILALLKLLFFSAFRAID